MKAIQWCEICNAYPAQGMLTVIRTGEVTPSIMMCCQKCVDDLDDSDWIDENDLCGGSP